MAETSRPARRGLMLILSSPSGAGKSTLTRNLSQNENNLDLSIRRADAVVKYLESRGISSDRLEAKGYGKQRPLVSDPAASVNRRVETRLREQ